MKSRGFTMIELMIVIVIIGILSVLGSAAYTKSLNRSRDARRVSDIKSIQKGFEQYSVVNDGYDPCSTMVDDPRYFPGGAPTDPSGGGYSYNRPGAEDDCGTGGEYCVCAEISEDNRASFGNSANNLCDFQSSNTNTHFCARNVQ